MAAPILLTPGPVSTAPATRAAMATDWPPWDGPFKAMTLGIGEKLVSLAGGTPDEFLTVPIVGSGSYAVEAMVGTLLPRTGARLLIVCNGNYGRRMETSVRYMGRDVVTLDLAETAAADPAAVAAALQADPAITHVAVVHVETTTGLFNPVDKVAAVVRAAGRRLWVDVVASLGILPVHMSAWNADAVALSSNKGIEGPPGLGFVIVRRSALAAVRGNAHSLCLDLEHQARFLEETGGRFRYTPPTHVIAAFGAALDAFIAEGGQAARFARYSANLGVLLDGMRALGFEPVIERALQAPVISTFHQPGDTRWNFQVLYDTLKAAGFLIFPGKVTQTMPTFRIGCIGQVSVGDMARVVEAAAAALTKMGMTSGAR